MNCVNPNYRWTLLATLLAALILPACVTINIYFPAAAAEKAADKIIDEVWQIDPAKQQDAPAVPN